MQSYAGLSSNKREVFARRKKDTRKGVMFEEAKKQLSVITGPSHRGDESHALTMDQCATVSNKQSLQLKITPRPQTEAISQRLPAARSKTQR